MFSISVACQNCRKASRQAIVSENFIAVPIVPILGKSSVESALSTFFAVDKSVKDGICSGQCNSTLQNKQLTMHTKHAPEVLILQLKR